MKGATSGTPRHQPSCPASEDGGALRGAIFDVDGTLLDSMYIWDTIGETYLRSIGYEPREQLNETFRNMSLYQAACYYRSEYGVTLSVDAIMDGVNAMIRDEYRYRIQPKPGIPAFLRGLHEKGVRMCIATATDRPLIGDALRRCGIDTYFTEIFTCNDTGHGKDEPHIYREALRHLGTDRADTVVFEDALYAVRTAKADGFIVAAVCDSHEPDQESLKAFADYYLPDFTDIESFWLATTEAERRPLRMARLNGL